MPAARYWRLVSVATYVRQADLELSEVAFFSASTRVDTTATITSSNAPTSGSLANLQDGNSSTIARFAGSDVVLPGFHVQWDFSTSTSITSIAVGASSSRANYPYAYSVLVSNDGTSWSPAFIEMTLQFPGAGLSSTSYIAAGAADEYYSKVELLLHMNGSNNGTVFTDNSVVPKTLTANGGTVTSTAQSKFGGSSALFPNTSSWLTVNLANSDLSFQTNDFTIEFWLFLPVGHPTDVIIMNRGDAPFTSNNSFLIRIGTVGFLEFYTQPAGSGNWSVLLSTGIEARNSTWTHYAICRRTNTFSVFVNGQLANSRDSNVNIFQSTRPLQIASGGWSPSGQLTNAYIDELRITIGVARYFIAFAVQDEAFIDSSGGVPQLTTSKPIYVSNGAAVGSATIGTFTPYASAYAIAPNLQAASVSTFQPYPQAYANAQSLSQRLELIYGGTGVLVGNVKKQALPSDIPISRKVRLYSDTRLVRETWSEPVTGNFTFSELSKECIYTAISYDYENNYRALISDKLRAV